MLRDRLPETVSELQLPERRYAASIDEDQADYLSWTPGDWHFIEVHPPADHSNPATLPRFVKEITEYQTKWLKLRNVSPVTAFEISRPRPDTLRFQYAAPTKRLARKVRTHLTEEIPEVGFSDGDGSLPAKPGGMAGGAILSPGRMDWYPLCQDYDRSPMNNVAAALHQHAMQDTNLHIQLLFQPVAGQPIRRWWRHRKAYKQIGFLRKEKEKLWGSRSPTPREKRQADAIEDKAGTSQFKVVVRFAVFTPDYGGDELLERTVKSRVKEVSGAFNVYEDSQTGQYLNTHTVRAFRPEKIRSFIGSIHRRTLDSHGIPFHASQPELAALVSLPDRQQDNITYSQP